MTIMETESVDARRDMAAFVIREYHDGRHASPLDRCGDLLCVGVRELLAWTVGAMPERALPSGSGRASARVARITRSVG
jgi:hypothetical protein